MPLKQIIQKNYGENVQLNILVIHCTETIPVLQCIINHIA